MRMDGGITGQEEPRPQRERDSCAVRRALGCENSKQIVPIIPTANRKHLEKLQ